MLWQNHYRAAVVSYSPAGAGPSAGAGGESTAHEQEEDRQERQLSLSPGPESRSYINDLRACIQACEGKEASPPAPAQGPNSQGHQNSE